jgi:hypothetical protein
MNGRTLYSSFHSIMIKGPQTRVRLAIPKRRMGHMLQMIGAVLVEG